MGGLAAAGHPHAAALTHLGDPVPQRTKITVLGGFLGSGKTTLLNGLLRETDEPLGIIVNDFGSINVDAQLLAGQVNVDGEVALQNGCICCTIRADLLTALMSLTKRPNPPKHIVIETSGISDPAAVARTFLHPQVAHLLELATIAVCVDPTTFPELADEEWSLASDQVRVADFVVLTKCDAATEAQRSACRELLRTVAEDLRVMESYRDSMPTELVLDTPKTWKRSRKLGVVRDTPHVHEVGEHHGHHHHGHAYETWTFRTDQPLSVYRLRTALRKLPPQVFRAKGFVHVAQDRAMRVVVQIAGRRAELAAGDPWGDDVPATEIVLLGPEGKLDPESLEALFGSCVDTRVESKDGYMDEMLGFFNRILSNLPQHRG